MNKLNEIRENGIVAIIRGQKSENVLPITDALYQGGIRTVEITADTPGLAEVVEQVISKYGKEMVVGVGTVLDPETAKIAISSGAHFVMAPTLNVDTIRITKRYGVISVPAAMTPTEILTAYEAGADLIKVFPARALGTGFIKDVHGPLPQIPLMPTGGVNLENMEDYIHAGAFALGIGGSLVKGNLELTEESLMALTSKAEQFVKKFNEIKLKKVGIYNGV